MFVMKLSKVALDSAAAGVEPVTSSRKSNDLTTVPPRYTFVASGAGTNLKADGTGPAQSAGHFLWSCPSMFGYKNTISRFGKRFPDGQ